MCRAHVIRLPAVVVPVLFCARDLRVAAAGALLLARHLRGCCEPLRRNNTCVRVVQYNDVVNTASGTFSSRNIRTRNAQWALYCVRYFSRRLSTLRRNARRVGRKNVVQVHAYLRIVDRTLSRVFTFRCRVSTICPFLKPDTCAKLYRTSRFLKRTRVGFQYFHPKTGNKETRLSLSIGQQWSFVVVFNAKSISVSYQAQYYVHAYYTSLHVFCLVETEFVPCDYVAKVFFSHVVLLLYQKFYRQRSDDFVLHDNCVF